MKTNKESSKSKGAGLAYQQAHGRQMKPARENLIWENSEAEVSFIEVWLLASKGQCWLEPHISRFIRISAG